MAFSLRPTIPCFACIRRGTTSCTITVEFVDGSGRTVAADDSGNPFIALTIAGTARSLGGHVNAAGQLSTQKRPGLPNAAVGAVILVTSGELNFNMAGNPDGVLGTTEGIVTAALAPTNSTNVPDYASAGTRIYVGDIDRTAR